MEFFNKAKEVRLRSHHNKYLVAQEDEETVAQGREGSSRRARWTVEFVEGNCHLIRLKSCYGKYLTAIDETFLAGMMGKKVVQDMPASRQEYLSINWEPRTDGFYVKLRTRKGKFLRANGGAPPWRNSVTHGVTHRTASQDWILWSVDVLDILELDSIPKFINSLERVAITPSGSGKSAMELFQKAQSIRLRSHHDKYLLADDDQENVSQDRQGTIRNAKWTVEFSDHANVIRLKSCYGKYLTASNMPFLLGMTGKKVLQTLPRRLDSSLEWEPIREGVQVKLRTRYGQYLRANGGLPPWRNSITHDIPHRTATQDWILWDVDIMEIRRKDPKPPLEPAQALNQVEASLSQPDSPSSISLKSPRFSRQESDDSYVVPPAKHEGRVIYYRVADQKGEADINEEMSFNFKGTMVEELRQRLEEETGLEDILVCSPNPLNGKLYPLRLHLPPNNADMHIVVVSSSGKEASNIGKPGSPSAT